VIHSLNLSLVNNISEADICGIFSLNLSKAVFHLTVYRITVRE